VVEESERLFGLAEKLGHTCWFEGSGKMPWCCGMGLGKLLRGEEMLGVGQSTDLNDRHRWASFQER